MTADTLAAKEELEEKGYTCVLRKGEEKCCSTQHGVKPLLEWIRKNRDFSGYGAADQVVGKAAALLYILLGVRDLYGQVVSEPAAAILGQYQVSFEYGKMVPFIINRTEDGMCPMEQAVLDISDPGEAVEALKAKLLSMGAAPRP